MTETNWKITGNNWIFEKMKKSTKIPLINLRHLFLGKNDVIGKMTEKSMGELRYKASYINYSCVTG